MRKIAILAAGLMLIPAVAQAKTLEELLVEKGVVTRAEAAGVSSSAAGRVYWNGGTRLEFPDNGFTTQINTAIQTRYTYTDADSDYGQNSSSFDVETARIIISGSALNNEFNYKLEGDFAGNQEENDSGGQVDQSSSPELLDAYLQWNACDWASARMGQFKTAVSRQFNTNNWDLQFIEITEASNLFNLGYQQGAQANWNWDSLSVSSAIFNGDSTGEGQNLPGVDTRMTGVFGARYNIMGDANPFVESDIAYSENAGWDFGAAYAYASGNQNVTPSADMTVTDTVNTQTVSVDSNFKYKGISVAGEFYYQDYSPDDYSGLDYNSQGFYLQTGYFLSPKKWEIAARYSYIDCDNGLAPGVCSGVDDVNQATGGINYYWWGNNLKASLNYDFLNQDELGADSGNNNTNRWMFQLSSYF